MDREVDENETPDMLHRRRKKEEGRSVRVSWYQLQSHIERYGDGI
jgi:hypothetical protein